MIDERIYLDINETERLERDINTRRHIERYCLARQFLCGRVADVACGAGYGSYLCQKNPDVAHITGVDASPEAIAWAKEHFATPKVTYTCATVNEFNGEFDTLMSLETIEHLENPREMAALAERCQVQEIVVSFPLKKTTHYNRFHRWDFTAEDMLAIFQNFACVATVNQNMDYLIMRLVRTLPRICPARSFRG